MNFAEDSKTANWLTVKGVPFTYTTGVRFSELVPNWEVINQGRPDGMAQDDALIEKYAFAGQNPANPFPAPILAPATDGLEVLDGIQRLSAAKLNDNSSFNAYILSPHVDPGTRASIRVCANSLNGQAPSIEWTISRVIDVLYEHHKKTVLECADWSGIPVKKLELEINARNGALWMQAHGIDITLKPANQKGFQAVFAELFPLAEREKVSKVLPKIVTSIQNLKANNNEAELVLRECTDFKLDKRLSLSEQLSSKFEEVINRPDIKARMMGRRKLHPVDNVLRAVASAVTVMRSAVDGDQHADPDQAEKIVEMISEARDLARKIVPKDQWGKIGYGPRRD